MSGVSPGMARYADRLLEAVAELAVLVRDECPAEVARRVRAVLARGAPPGVDPVVGLVVALAAAVPVDQSLAYLFAWTQVPATVSAASQAADTGQLPDPARLRAGHAAYKQLLRLDVAVPAEVRELERAYQRLRKANYRVASRIDGQQPARQQRQRGAA